ncbi:alcohol dehydrogenase catalytic domain-containing protein [Paraburkholderia fungorum]|uniref:alcohol dehydrogenase catalytic domain-containing protein n=1 Tax=Paraburkholderia fungorum TaxID=134537 RepID=UPI0038BDB658
MNETLHSNTFKAAVAVEPSRTEIQTFDRPATTALTGLLRVAITGVWGSGGPYYRALPQSRGPLIPGHETVGHIEEAGELAKARWGLKEGDYVALEEYVPCGHREYCLSNEFRLCNATDWRLNGLRYGATGLRTAPSFWGGFGQYQYLQLNTVFHCVPSSVAPKYAALALPLGNGIEWAYLQGGAGPGQAVVIQGPGQQGLSCVVAAREAGAKKLSSPAFRLKRTGSDSNLQKDSVPIIRSRPIRKTCLNASPVSREVRWLTS